MTPSRPATEAGTVKADTLTVGDRIALRSTANRKTPRLGTVATLLHYPGDDETYYHIRWDDGGDDQYNWKRAHVYKVKP